MKPKIVGWMGKRDASCGADTNYRRLEQDYEFSGGYGLKEPAGWEPLYALDAKDLLILELYREQHTEALATIRQQKTPCGECHLQPGERCDVCGAYSGT